MSNNITIANITNTTKQTCTNYIKKIMSSQDFSQRLYMTINVTIELYRILVSSLLILFVPQNCTGHLCSIGENLIWDSLLYNVSISFNFATLFIFLVLFCSFHFTSLQIVCLISPNPFILLWDAPLSHQSTSFTKG
jgi:hypothetical protein